MNFMFYVLLESFNIMLLKLNYYVHVKAWTLRRLLRYNLLDEHIEQTDTVFIHIEAKAFIFYK